MTEKMQKLLFVQNARPDLQETLDFIENQVTVESMTKAPTKVADTVNNVLDEPKKTDNIRCWDYWGRHKRSECTADKKSLYCKRGRKATRSPSQSGYSTRSSAPSPASTSSEETEQKEEKKKKKQRRSRRDNKSKEDSRQQQQQQQNQQQHHQQQQQQQ